MASLVIADHNNQSLSDAVAKTVSAAAKMGGDVDILVAGSNASAAAEEASKIAGVRKVLHADDPAYDKLLAEPMAALIVSLAGGYDALLAPATANGALGGSWEFPARPSTNTNCGRKGRATWRQHNRCQPQRPYRRHWGRPPNHRK